VDSIAAAERLGDRGVSSAQFVLASALSLILFVMLANLVVVQYGRGAIRSALEQGARAGSVSGENACREAALGVVADLLGGRMSDDVTISCELIGNSIEATASARFETWTPLVPDYEFSLVSSAAVEP
jgi:hypothetical protein